MKIVKRAVMVIYRVVKVYFLLASAMLLVGLVFVIFPVAAEYWKKVDNPALEYFPAIYFLFGLLWSFIILFRVLKGQIESLAEKDPIAFSTVLISLMTIISSFFLWMEWGIAWWVGGAGVLSIFGLFGLAYLILKVIKHKRLRIVND